MATTTSGATAGSVLKQLERLFTSGTLAGLDEAQLLHRFVHAHDETAFEALVDRHGPMVYALCRRMLKGDHHAAADAFQATFLVLVKRAPAIRDPNRLGPWLHGVAYRVALRARANQARQHSREQGSNALLANEPIAPESPEQTHGRSHPALPALDESLARLPRSYQQVLVLCDLEGRTHEEAARLLDWPLGTVKGRLHRAREKLRLRLQQSGFTVPATALAATLSHEARAAVPPLLLNTTVRAALSFAAGTTATTTAVTVAAVGLSSSAAATHLAKGVLHAMFLTKLKLTGTTAAVLLASSLATTTGVWAYQFGGTGRGRNPAQKSATATAPGDPFADRSQQPATSTQPEIKDSIGDSELESYRAKAQLQAARAKLEEARAALVRQPFETTLQQLGNGYDINAAYLASLRILSQEIQDKNTPKELEIPFGAHMVRMNRLQTRVKERNTDLAKKADQLKQMGMMSNGSGGMDAMMGMGGMGGGYGSGALTSLNPAEADYYMAQAELWVAEIKAGSTAPTGLQDALAALSHVAFKADSIDPFGRRSSAPARASSPKPAEPELAQTIPPTPASAAPEDPFAAAPAEPSLPIARTITNTNTPPPSPANPPQPGEPPVSAPYKPEPTYDARTQAILDTLDKPIDLPFDNETPLQDVLQYLKTTTENEKLPNGLPFFIDATGYVEREVTQRMNQPPAGPNEGGALDDGPPNISEALRSLQTEPILIDLKGVPLKTSLRLILKQAGLGYVVKDGIILIGALNTNSFQQELFNGTIVPKYGEAGSNQIIGGMGGMGGGFR